MTDPGQPRRPWNAPTAALPVTGRRLTKRQLIAVLAASAVALCCGGPLTIGLLAGPDTPRAAITLPPAPSTPAPSTTPAGLPAHLLPGPVPSTTGAPLRTLADPDRTTAAAQPTRTQRATPRVTRTTQRPRPQPTRTTSSPARKAVHPGAFCGSVGAIGYTSKGTRMRCTIKNGEDRARWRKA